MKTNNDKHIFIVDDDSIYLQILKFELEEIKGIQISTFQSAESCLEKLDIRPDLIILDYYLDSIDADQMTGHEALSLFQRWDPQPSILLISSKVNEGLLEEYKKYRSVDFILKTPWGSAQLQQKVKQYLFAA